jgi:hypothetical protein
MADERIYTKVELLALLRDEFGRWEKLLSSLSPDQLAARDLPGGLSVKDVMAHLWAWQGLSVARLEAAIDNRDPDYDLGPEGLDPDNEQNLERINAWIHQTNLDRPWMEVYGNWRRQYLWFLELAEKLPEQALMQPARYTWLRDTPLSAVLRGSYLHHHEEHYEPLTAILRQRGLATPD